MNQNELNLMQKTDILSYSKSQYCLYFIKHLTLTIVEFSKCISRLQNKYLLSSIKKIVSRIYCMDICKYICFSSWRACYDINYAFVTARAQILAIIVSIPQQLLGFCTTLKWRHRNNRHDPSSRKSSWYKAHRCKTYAIFSNFIKVITYLTYTVNRSM